MPWWDKRAPSAESAEEIVFDDGGSGLFEACIARFGGLGWSIKCDSSHAVWVKSPDAPLSVGLAPWMADHLPTERVLDELEAKIRSAESSAVS